MECSERTSYLFDLGLHAHDLARGREVPRHDAAVGARRVQETRVVVDAHRHDVAALQLLLRRTIGSLTGERVNVDPPRDRASRGRDQGLGVSLLRSRQSHESEARSGLALSSPQRQCDRRRTSNANSCSTGCLPMTNFCTTLESDMSQIRTTPSEPATHIEHCSHQHHNQRRRHHTSIDHEQHHNDHVARAPRGRSRSRSSSRTDATYHRRRCARRFPEDSRRPAACCRGPRGESRGAPASCS